MVQQSVSLKARIAAIFKAEAHEQLAIDDTVGGKVLTASKYQKTITGVAPNVDRLVGAQRAVITTEDQSMRYTYDGTAPTTTVGHLATAGTIITLNGYDNIANFKAIRTGGSSAEINVTYEF